MTQRVKFHNPSNSNNRMDQLVSHFSKINQKLSTLATENTEKSICWILDELVQLTATDRIAVWIWDHKNATHQTLYQSTKEGNGTSDGDDNSRAIFNWLSQKTRNVKIIRIEDLQSLDGFDLSLKDGLIQHDFRSLVSIPSHISPDLFCVNHFLSIGRAIQWSDQDIQIFQFLSELLTPILSKILMGEENRKLIQRYQILYDHSPIAIWEEDFSKVKRFIDRKHFKSSEQCQDYFQHHQTKVVELLSSIQILDVNDTTIQLWNHSSKTSLVGSLKLSNIPGNIDKYIGELVAISEGKLYHKIENLIITGASGRDNYVNLYWNVMPGHEKDWEQVLVSAVDNTGQLASEMSLRVSEERLRMLVDNAEDIIFLQDVQGRMLFFYSPPIYSIDEEPIAGNFPREILPVEYANHIDETFSRVLETREPIHYETQVSSSRGLQWISFLAYPVYDQANHLKAVGTIGRNITRQKDAEVALAEAQKALSDRISALEKRNVEISLLSEILTVLQFSPELDEAYKLVGNVIRQLFSGLNGSVLAVDPDRAELSTRVSWGRESDLKGPFRVDDCLAIQTGKPYLNSDTTQEKVCAHIEPPFPRSTYCVPIRIDNLPAGCLSIQPESKDGVFQDGEIRLANSACEQLGLALTNIKLRQGLREQAIQDGLTGLYNRLYMDESLSREIYRQERKGLPLSVIMIDFDNLKEINDLYGHAAGDAVLRALGHLLKQSVRVSDLPCRYGGDEFVLVMPETSHEIARKRAEKIAYSFRGLSIPFGTQTIGGYTLSIGVATSPVHGHTSQDLLSAADAALYKAKRTGRDRIVSAGEESE